VFLKNAVNYAVQELSRFIKPIDSKLDENKEKKHEPQKQEGDQDARIANNPEAVTKNIRLIRFKMGSVTSNIG
jgi:hypothetical protein